MKSWSVPCVSFVESVQASRLLLFVDDADHRAVVKAFAASHDLLFPRNWWVRYESESELVAILETLRDAGFAFAGAPAGWPPSAVFEELRDRGLLRGTFTEITWRGPDEPVLRTR